MHIKCHRHEAATISCISRCNDQTQVINEQRHVTCSGNSSSARTPTNIWMLWREFYFFKHDTASIVYPSHPSCNPREGSVSSWNRIPGRASGLHLQNKIPKHRFPPCYLETKGFPVPSSSVFLKCSLWK